MAGADISTLIAGKATGGSWSFEDIANIGSYSSRGPVGGFDIVQTATGSNVVFLYFYDDDRADFYCSTGSSWSERKSFFWPVSGDLEMTLSPSGGPVLVSKDAIAIYW